MKHSVTACMTPYNVYKRHNLVAMQCLCDNQKQSFLTTMGHANKRLVMLIYYVIRPLMRCVPRQTLSNTPCRYMPRQLHNTVRLVA